MTHRRRIPAEKQKDDVLWKGLGHVNRMQKHICWVKMESFRAAGHRKPRKTWRKMAEREIAEVGNTWN